MVNTVAEGFSRDAKVNWRKVGRVPLRKDGGADAPFSNERGGEDDAHSRKLQFRLRSVCLPILP